MSVGRHIRRALSGAALVLLVALPATAQSQVPLQVQESTFGYQTDIYGQRVPVASGTLVNPGDAPVLSVMLQVSAYDAADTLIGEGFGYLVDACGAGLLPDYALPPGHVQSFSAPLELFEADAAVERLEVQAVGEAGPADALPARALADGLTQISDQEVVEARWESADALRYAIGCPRDLASDWRWRRLSGGSADVAIDNPDAARVTPELRERLSLSDPLIFASSRLSFAPGGTRLVYQDRVNRFYTAAADGRFQRQIHGGLNAQMLQQVQWLEGDRFIARYFGAYGDPVLYFTADADGRAISPSPLSSPPSVILPGASVDGRRVVIGGSFSTEAGEDVSGYYLNVVSNGFFELLFESALPGLNYPAPVPVVDPAEDRVVRVYVVRPVDGQVRLQCFQRDTRTLVDLAPLPLSLSEGDRSGMWLSPDGATLAISATGVRGGLWLARLSALPSC
jgi:hypothetical protein